MNTATAAAQRAAAPAGRAAGAAAAPAPGRRKRRRASTTVRGRSAVPCGPGSRSRSAVSSTRATHARRPARASRPRARAGEALAARSGGAPPRAARPPARVAQRPARALARGRPERGPPRRAGCLNGPLISYTAPGPGASGAGGYDRCEVQYRRVPDGSKITPQTSDLNSPSTGCAGPVKRRNGETSRSGVIRPISMLPPSSHTKISPADETVTLSTASSEESVAAARSKRTSSDPAARVVGPDPHVALRREVEDAAVVPDALAAVEAESSRAPACAWASRPASAWGWAPPASSRARPQPPPPPRAGPPRGPGTPPA